MSAAQHAQRTNAVLQVAALPLNPTLRQQLLNQGFHTTADLAGVSAENLARRAQISPADAQNTLVATTLPPGLTGVQSAKDIFEREAKSRKVMTFCQELDAALGGGVATGQVTEFCGVPAVGKTQLGVQLCIDVQLPRCFGGLEGKAIYLDTEGSFMVERAADIAESFLEHLKKIQRPSTAAKVASLSVEGLLDSIQFLRIHDHVEQLAAVQMLPELLDATPGVCIEKIKLISSKRSATDVRSCIVQMRVKLIVLDSVAFHFRQNFTDMGQRTRVLAQMAQQLMQIASTRDVAVVLMNQVTTKVGTDGSSKLVPALGDSWAHAATTRVILFWNGERRCAHLYKSPSLPTITVDYFINAEGFRGRKHGKRPRNPA